MLTRTFFRDECYHREEVTTKDETIITTKSETVPLPITEPVTTKTTSIVTSYPKTEYVSQISPRVSRIRFRSPSIRSVRVHSTPRVTFISPQRLYEPFSEPFCCKDNVINIKIEKENECPIMKASVYNYDYSFSETFERKHKRSKSMTGLNENSYELEKIELKRKPSIRNVAVVYENNRNDNRHVHFCDQIEDDDNKVKCVSSLVSASPSFLPVNRSIQVGSIFNGNSFGILCNYFFSVLLFCIFISKSKIVA